MPSIGKRIFGYRIITPENGREEKLASALITLGISAEGRADGGFAISESDFRRFASYAGGRVRYTVSERLGLLGAVYKNLYRWPSLVFLLLAIALDLFLSGLVWDVRIEGNEAIESDVVVDALADVGLAVGSSWSDIDAEHVEGALLSSLREVAWIQINRRGTVAYVKISERAPTTLPEAPLYKCSNIVADRDCVIEEITVESGRAMVKAGDVVRRGDVLISGVIEAEGGTVFTVARGNVRAHATGSLEHETAREERYVEYERGDTLERGVRVFSFKINIFKNYGNLEGDYVIIENEEEFVFLDGHRLPFAVYECYADVAVEHTREYTDAELPAAASSELLNLLRTELHDKDLIKLSTSGEYTDTGYKISAEYVYSCEVGCETEIDLGDFDG